MPQCPYCDREVAYDARFCPSCGKRDPADNSSSGGAPNSPATEGFVFFLFIIGYALAAILCGLLGWGVGGAILYAAGSMFGHVNANAVFGFSTIFGVICAGLVIRNFFTTFGDSWDQIGSDVELSLRRS
jgi:hypothetical protein